MHLQIYSDAKEFIKQITEYIKIKEKSQIQIQKKYLWVIVFEYYNIWMFVLITVSLKEAQKQTLHAPLTSDRL